MKGKTQTQQKGQQDLELQVQRTDDCLYIFMEYMPGQSVKDYIKLCTTVSGKLAWSWTYQILKGVAYLHQYDIVHRDIKSANVLR